ncbi:hypothetical protein NMG60_11003436 [Bertholletia excelsa]
MAALDSANEISYGNSTLAFPAEEESFKIMIDSLVEQNERHLYSQCIIERVPQLLQNSGSNNKDYDPMMVSIGPYHHGKKRLQRAEKVKPIMAQLYVFGSGRTLHEFYIAILPKVNDLKSYYVKGSTDKYSNEEFATMMLLDGCLVWVIIEAFASSFGHECQIYMDEIDCLGMHAWPCLAYDILWLMENQLPFEVLQLLMSLKYEGDDGMKKMSTFLDLRVYGDAKPVREIKVDASDILAKQQPLHLLELSYLTGNGDPISQKKRPRSKSGANYKLSEAFYFFRSVSELKAKGIFVRCNGSYSATSVKFRSFFFVGLVDLPIIIISPGRRIVCSNLIAYELTQGDANRGMQTYFTNFMKSLINHPDDVKELRSKHVLISEQYSSDEEVVNIMKSITIYPITCDDPYKDIREMIQKHYNSKAKTWIAEFIHNYFSSPWVIIAFLAAILVVGLSCIQTYFTVYPRR